MIFDMMHYVKLSVYKLDKEVSTPKFGTSLSTCFDIEYFPTKDHVVGYSKSNEEVVRKISPTDKGVTLEPGDRLLIPTGLIFKIQDPSLGVAQHAKYSLRFHPRSGLALKRGLILANSEGVVDVDYQEEAYAIIYNMSDTYQTIAYKERICQAEVVSNQPFLMNIVEEKPERMSERNGGFGSTGTK
jgi:dUTP pyrophosphatase